MIETTTGGDLSQEVPFVKWRPTVAGWQRRREPGNGRLNNGKERVRWYGKGS